MELEGCHNNTYSWEICCKKLGLQNWFYLLRLWWSIRFSMSYTYTAFYKRTSVCIQKRIIGIFCLSTKVFLCEVWLTGILFHRFGRFAIRFVPWIDSRDRIETKGIRLPRTNPFLSRTDPFLFLIRSFRIHVQRFSYFRWVITMCNLYIFVYPHNKSSNTVRTRQNTLRKT